MEDIFPWLFNHHHFILIHKVLKQHMAVSEADCEIIVTQGRRGAKWRDKQFPAPLVDVHDVTGAGDVFLASLCYFQLVFNDMSLSIERSVYLASKSVQHMGVYILTEDDINEVLK